MAREKLSMRKLSEVLRLKLEQKLSVRQIAQGCNLARSTGLLSIDSSLNRSIAVTMF